MQSIATTKMTAKGQVVIPEEIRNCLGIEPGAKFVVVAQGDSILFKKLQAPSKKEFNSLLKKARAAAKKYKIKKSDLEQLLK